jgi:hypothetical protein
VHHSLVMPHVAPYLIQHHEDGSMDRSKIEAKLAEIAVFIEEAEKAAYARGFQDALDKVTVKITDIATRVGAIPASPLLENVPLIRTPKVESKLEPREGSDQARVLVDIKRHPGTRGFEIVKRLDGQVHERTIRTSIHRLKIRKAISKQGDKWFPGTMTPESSRGGQTPEASGNPSGGMAERPNAADSKSVGES